MNDSEDRRLDIRWQWLILIAIAGFVLFFVRLLKEMRLNQQQAEFLATVSHELKTPIATLELSSSLLRAGGLSARR